MDFKVVIDVVVCTVVFSVTAILVLGVLAFLDVMAGADVVVSEIEDKGSFSIWKIQKAYDLSSGHDTYLVMFLPQFKQVLGQ